MMYMPSTSKSEIVKRLKVGDMYVQIRTDITSIGTIEYTHMAIVFTDLEKPPIFFVTAEVNKNLAGLPNVGSHFLCTFDEERHSNLNCSNDWADLEKFTQAALQVIEQKFSEPKSDA